MGLPEVSSILWKERRLLELLAFKLQEEQLVVTAGLARWLPLAIREVELVLDELRQIEGPRVGALEALATELGLPSGRSLGEMAAAAPAPWAGLLEQHHQAFAVASQEIETLEQAHHDLLGDREAEATAAWFDGGAAWESSRPALRLLPDESRDLTPPGSG